MVGKKIPLTGNLLSPNNMNCSKYSDDSLVMHTYPPFPKLPISISLKCLLHYFIYLILCSVKSTLLLTIGSNFTNLNFSGVLVTFRLAV